VQSVGLDGGVVVAVLAAALLHAGWNAIAKAGRDPLLNVAAITTGSGLGAAALLPFVPLPDPAAWPFLAASVLLHFLYQVALVRAYSLGDLSQVYPMARGLAPLGVALLAVSVGEVPGALQAAGLALASAGIASLAFTGRATHGLAAVPSALLVSIFIAAYTFVDGLGVRAAGPELSYIAWMMFLDTFPMLALALLWRGGDAVRAFLKSEGLRAAGGGLMALAGYGVVLWAMARTEMAPVAALRETSVVFAAFLGSRLLGEPFGARRVTAAAAVTAGLIAVQVGAG